MFEVKIHIVAPELVAAISQLVSAAAAAAGPVVERPTRAEPKEPKAPKAEPKTEPKVEEPASAGDEQTVEQKRAEATKLLQKINQQNGIEAVHAALGEFGAKNVSSIPDDKLDEALATFGDKIS